MKTTKSITIDIEVWSEAKIKYDNVSLRVEQLIQEDLKQIEKNSNPKELENQIKDQQAIIASLKASMNKLEDQKQKKKISYDSNEHKTEFDPRLL